MLASVPLIPKFASEGAAISCELRNRDTGRTGHAAPAGDGAGGEILARDFPAAPRAGRAALGVSRARSVCVDSKMC